MFKQWIDRSTYLLWIPPTIFLGYNVFVSDDIHLLKDFDVQWQRILVFDATPFYAESWGQIWDRGVVLLDNGETVRIIQVQKYNGVFLHFVE